MLTIKIIFFKKKKGLKVTKLSLIDFTCNQPQFIIIFGIYFNHIFYEKREVYYEMREV